MPYLVTVLSHLWKIPVKYMLKLSLIFWKLDNLIVNFFLHYNCVKALYASQPMDIYSSCFDTFSKKNCILTHLKSIWVGFSFNNT